MGVKNNKHKNSAVVQSQNTRVDLKMPGHCFMGLASTGNIMIGDKAFEYYNEKNVHDYIQIPWEEVDYIAASVYGRSIRRFAIFTKENGHFTFGARDNKAMLRAITSYVPAEKMFRSLGLFAVIKKGFLSLFPHKKKTS